jgi:hypothetical protein
VKGGIEMKEENNCGDVEIMSEDDENRGTLRFINPIDDVNQIIMNETSLSLFALILSFEFSSFHKRGILSSLCSSCIHPSTTTPWWDLCIWKRKSARMWKLKKGEAKRMTHVRF